MDWWWRKRRETETADPPREHKWWEDALAEKQHIIDAFDKGIEKLINEHNPHPEREAMRPGNSTNQVRFYCDVCRTPWPCRAIYDLRALFGDAHDWAPAHRRLKPLVLEVADNERSISLKGGGERGDDE